MTESRWPLYAALVGGACYIAAVEVGFYDPRGNSVADAVVLIVTLPLIAGLSVRLGLLHERLASLCGIGILTVALQWGDPNPFPAMITIGFWLVGTAVRFHRLLASALRLRADELESGRARYTKEALRYEHVRIARELHDIVAHGLSVIVIQATAGGRLAPEDPTASEMLDTITALSDQMRIDLDGLARLLDDEGGLGLSVTRDSVEQLLALTAATGSTITCQLPDDFDELPGPLAGVVYRVLQEGLTNAIKHAPGAAVEVTIVTIGKIGITLTNDPTRVGLALPAAPGSGRGIAGLTERVHVANGTFSSGPTPQGGWQLSAELPR